MADKQIIIKRVKKVSGGHHGGAWKVAYADFVTAMMAFFLLLWLLNAVTEEQLTGISNYFAPTMASQNNSGAGGILGGQVIGHGAETSQTNSPSLVEHLPPSSIGPGGQDLTASSPQHKAGGQTKETKAEKRAELRKEMAAREQRSFVAAEQTLEKAISGIPELKPYKGSLLIDNTPQGLRIQITDQNGLAMFPSGSSAMYGYTRALIDLVAQVINKLPNKISISGHTDSVPYHDPNGYTNWELSADRALATRRALIAAGVNPSRVERVVGRAATDPLIKSDPKSPRNRRISITLLRQSDLTPSPSVPLTKIGPSGAAQTP